MNTARSVFVLVGALAVAPLSLGAQAGQEDSEPTPQVRTAATAERSVRADLAIVTVTFFVEDTTPGAAGRKLAAKTDSLRRALGTLGIPRDSLVNRSQWYWWRGRIEAVPQPLRYVQRDTPTRRYSETVQRNERDCSAGGGPARGHDARAPSGRRDCDGERHGARRGAVAQQPARFAVRLQSGDAKSHGGWCAFGRRRGNRDCATEDTDYRNGLRCVGIGEKAIEGAAR